MGLNLRLLQIVLISAQSLGVSSKTSSLALSSLQSSSDNGASSSRAQTNNSISWNSSNRVSAVTSASSHVPGTLNSFSTSNTSLPDSTSPSRSSSDLNTTRREASSNTIGVPNETSINSIYATLPTTLTNSGPATTQAVNSHTTKDSSTVPVAPTTADFSPKQTTTTSGLSAPSSLQRSSDKRTSPLTTSISIYTTSRETSNASSVTTETPHDSTLPSYPTSSVSLQDSASQSRTSSDLNITKSEASSHITGVPNQTISINSSHVTWPMTLTNSGPATTQALYFTSDQPTRQSSNVPVAPTATDSSTKQTTTTSVSVSFKLTEWSVDSSDCQRNCSNVGGTVTASRQCYLHTVTFDNSLCTKHQLKKVFKCGQLHCPISGCRTFSGANKTSTNFTASTCASNSPGTSVCIKECVNFTIAKA